MLPSPGGRTAGLLLLVAVADQAVLLRSPGVAAARHAAQPAARGPARPLALRGGAGEDEAGVAHALLEPSFAAAAPARTNPRSGATRVAFGDFPGAPPAKRRRGDGPAGLREITGKKDEYEELFGDLHTPERPGFLESIPELPQYEPDSDELGDDDDVPLDVDTQMQLAGCDYEEWVKVYDAHTERLNAGRRHKETDHGQGYLEGRWGSDDIMGWGRYRPLMPAQRAAPEMLAKEPRYRLNRHLLHAAETGDVELMQMLVQAGAEIDASNNESFLPASVRFGLNHAHSHEPLTENVTLTYGSVDAQRGEAQIAVYRWTALHWAASAGHQAAVSVLVAPRESGGLGGGMLLDMADHERMTAMHWAAGAGHAAVVSALLEAGARPDLNDTCSNTPLHFAAWSEHLEVMERLLEADGRLSNRANSGGYTPLHWAARQGHLEAVKLLLQSGADPEVHAGDDDLTPLNLAEEHGREQVAEALAASMGLVKIGPAQMDSVTRRAFAEKVESRLQELERQIAQLESARNAHEEGRRVQLDHAGHIAAHPLGVDMEDTQRIAQELQRLQEEMALQQDYQQQVAEAEAKFESAVAPDRVELSGGFVLPPLFSADREKALVLDLPANTKPKTNTKPKPDQAGRPP